MKLPTRCVIDASVGIKLFLEEVHSEKAQEFMEAMIAAPSRSMHVPDLFFAECANILWKAVKRLGYPLENARDDLAILRRTRFVRSQDHELCQRALDLACELGLSAYDACYVALAESLGIPLVTADERLAAKLAGTSHQVVTLAMV